jgi:hypothetical protein
VRLIDGLIGRSRNTSGVIDNLFNSRKKMIRGIEFANEKCVLTDCCKVICSIEFSSLDTPSAVSCGKIGFEECG